MAMSCERPSSPSALSNGTMWALYRGERDRPRRRVERGGFFAIQKRHSRPRAHRCRLPGCGNDVGAAPRDRRMPEPSFPPDSIRAPLVVRRGLAETAGQPLVVGPAETAVFVQNGRVLGELGPGTHRVDPRTLPFLAAL